MSSKSRVLRNLARGSGRFHFHRREIVRGILDRPGVEQQSLSDFLARNFFGLPDGWSVFQFHSKDWKICERLLESRNPAIETRLLDLVLAYAAANDQSVARLYALGATISDRLLRRDTVEVDAESDLLTPVDAQSLFGLRVGCASDLSSTEAMIDRLEQRLRKGWARYRLVHPMVYHFSSNPPAGALDSFLSYVVTGREHDAEKLALKLMLSDEAARDTSLAFKCFIGLMGHPYDAAEFVLDHIEHEFASGVRLESHLVAFVESYADMQPRSRASVIAATLRGELGYISGTRSDGLSRRFNLQQDELDRYAALCDLELVGNPYDQEASRPFGILTNMRASEFPDPLQFQLVTAEHAVWHFLDAGRLIGALLRSIYMIPRSARDLEVRDSFRLLYFLGFANPFLATTPSALVMLKRLHDHGAVSILPSAVEEATDVEMRRAPFSDRLWINELQWRLRRLEEKGRIQDWLRIVRTQTRLRPSFLTGINWHWVEEVISVQRLRPFRSFDGVYLFIHMELETNADPLRLRLTLEPLIRGMGYWTVIDTIIQEFGWSAPALVRRYLTTQNLLSTELAPNYLAALDQRVRALEACIRAFGFGPLLDEEIYESEVKALTAELLLTDVNAGKFEVPWDTFRKDASHTHQDLYRAVESLRPRLDEAAPLTAIVETPITFPNGRTQAFRVRNRDQPLFAFVIAVLSGFMQHPAFGIEVILSGRFRHNNLLQELWSAIMTEVIGATIPSVTLQTKKDLVEEYKLATERIVDGWCAARLQTKRPEKPDGLFDLIPEPKEVEGILSAAMDAGGMLSITDVVIDWIKGRLRAQVEAAREAFGREVKNELTAAFEAITERKKRDVEFREADVQLVHNALNDAVMRKVDDLRNWFEGVDTQTSGPISLGHLSLAAETLFENMIPGKTLRVEMDAEAATVTFEARQVKIAFDLLRELYFNALRHGTGPDVELTINGTGAFGSFAFRNKAEPCSADELGEAAIEGHVYHSRNDAVTREGDSGLAKIAASSATLVGHDASVLRRRGEQSYEVVVSLRPKEAQA